MADFLDDLVEQDELNTADSILPEEKQTTAPSTGVDHSKIEELEQRSKGFYNNMKEERRKRQDIQSELDRVKGTVAAILEMRKQQPQLPAELQTPTRKFNGLAISETEDGDLYVPAEQLAPLLTPYESKIAALEQRLQQNTFQRNVEDETQKVLQSIVGEDERFGPAYQKYTAARKWINDRVIEYQKETGMRGPMTSGQALDTVFSDSEVERDFKAKFPGLQVEDIVQAEDSQRLFRRTMSNIAKVLEGTSERVSDDRFRKVLNKPAGLGSATNAKGAKLSISEKMADLSPNDIMNLSDDQVKQLEKALFNEEKTDGLSFSQRW